MSFCFPSVACVCVLANLLAFSWAGAVEFSWQEPHAKALATGDLEYAPEPFVFAAGESRRFIDFEDGDDAAAGTRESPWKHHPWDPEATANAKTAAGESHTYIFKGGVTYCGRFVIPDGAGTNGEVRLTRDPSWGEGEAVLSGAEWVTGWTRLAHPKMPDGDKVWSAEVGYLPRNLWVVPADAEPRRLTLARWPNWTEPDPNDVLSEWPTWDQPEWWKEKNMTKIGRNTKHVGIARSLPEPLEDLVGGTVWSEWGIVMGSPYPALIEGVAEVTQGKRTYKGIVFRGPWTYGALEKIITGNRYFLENLPQFLDEPGEFWVEKTGKAKARIYLRLPDGADPSAATIEAARHYNFFEGTNVGSIAWSGLTFRFGNVDWDYNHPRWGRPNLRVAAIRLHGAAESIEISHNTFEHLPMPVRIEVGGASQRIGAVRIHDNHMRDTDQGAVLVENFTDNKEESMGTLGRVEFLRNRLERIGLRIVSGEHGHAVSIAYPQTSHLAGNFLHRISGWGLAVWGGKPSGMAGVEAPLSRHLIHHNRVEDVLLKSNDWGGIETWQGGSFYVFNNIVLNAIGYKNWIFAQGNKERASSFGHAYYLDGSFKNYLFNNIGRGRNNDPATKSVNLTAIQNIISFENWFFHNSFHRFVVATRQQAPQAGRFRYLGNAFSDVSQMLYRHAEPKDGQPDPNASHYTQGGSFDYKTLAYDGNVIHALASSVGVFEETGVVYREPAGFSEALARVCAQADHSVREFGVPVFRDPDAMDWRPTGPLAEQSGVRVFVPWGLDRTVGEWNFTRNNANPNEVIDEHWFMTTAYADRKTYKDMPRHPLIGESLTVESYRDGLLEDWTAGALRLDGRSQFLRTAQETLPAADSAAVPRSVDVHDSSFLIEAVFRTSDPEGILVEKMRSRTGYRLRLSGGQLLFAAADGEGLQEVSVDLPVSDGKWHHVLAEFDRETGAMRIYLDGRPLSSPVPFSTKASLGNSADFLVGGRPGGGGSDFLAADLDFLRVALTTLAQSQTSIDELHAWQFDGPQFRDFAGRDRQSTNRPGALVE